MSETASSLAVRTAPEPGSPVKGMTGFAHRYADVSDTRLVVHSAAVQSLPSGLTR